MSSDKAPYATLHDLPKYEKRGDVVSAPWLKDQAHVQSGRGTTNEPYVACNSQTAPFATFHNMPQAMEYVGPLPDAPWEKDQQPPPASRGPLYDYSKSIPYGTSENYQHQKQNSASLPDAPWEKEQRSQIPSRGALSEHSKLPSSQTAPFGTSENMEVQEQTESVANWQYSGPMPNAPWDKDQRPSIQQRVPSVEYSRSTPYATFDNMDRQKQSTEQMDEAPWNKDQRPPPSSRGCAYHDPVPYPSSHTAPYATFDNRITPQPNKARTEQAPWDRDEVHYNKVPQRFPNGEDAPHYISAHAPFATESR